jgi:predicted Zn finger-like uncharacterized protein
MIIKCPSCETKYTVKEDAIKPRGRTVRCANCGKTWHEEGSQRAAEDAAMPAKKPLADMDRFVSTRPDTDTDTSFAQSFEADVAEEQEEASASETDVSELVARRPLREEPQANHAGEPGDTANKPSKGASAGLLAASLLIIVITLCLEKKTIEAVWPSSARIYDLVGLGSPSLAAGLELHDVHSVLRTDGGVKTLLIDGMITSTAKEKRTVPDLDASVLLDGKPIKNWTFSSGASVMSPSEPVRFSTSVDAADLSSGKLFLTFSAKNSVVPAE